MKLVVSCAVGYVLSKKGILDQNAISSMSKLIIFVFQPCLLFVNVAATLGNPGQSLSEILVLPVFAVLQIFFRSIVGRGMAKLLHLPAGSPEGRELRMCTSFGNSGPLPLLFVESLFGSNPDSTMASNAVAYISFYLLGYSPLFWTARYSMMAGRPLPAAAMSEEDQKEFNNMDPVHKFVARCLRTKDSPTFKRVLSPSVIGCIAGIMVGLAPWGRLLLLGTAAPLSPAYTALQSLGSAYTPASILVLAGSLARPPPPRPPPANTNNNMSTTAINTNTSTSTNTKTTKVTTNTKNTYATTTTTDATGLLEALEAGEAGKNTAASIGAAPPGYNAIPSNPPHPLGAAAVAATAPTTASAGPGAAGAAAAAATAASTMATKQTAFYKKIVAILASRFVVTPLIAAGLLILGSKMDLTPDDKLIWFVVLMQACMPSAQNSVVMLQMENKADIAESMAATLAAVYLLSAVPVAMLLSAILEFVNI